MKTKNLLAAALLIVTLGLTACSNEDEGINGPDVVQINSSINQSGTSLRANIDDYTGLGNFEDGDVWGMFADASGIRVLDNSTYTVGSTILYWSNLSETVPVTFYAYYPQIAGTITDPTTYIFNAASALNPDLLVAAPVTASKGTNVSLNFNHVMHQLMIQLGGNVTEVGDVTSADISLLNMKSSAKVNLLTGAVDISGASGTSAYPVKTGGGVFLVAPQNLTTGADWIQITLDGKTYTYKVPATITSLQSGKRLILTLTLKKGGNVGLTQAVVGWLNQTVDPIEEDVIAN